MSTCRDERPFDHPDAHEVLPLDLLKDAAELRAAGRDWTEAGAALGRDHDHLRLACRRDPRFAEEMELARREVLREAEAEVLRKLREQLRSEDERLSADAAERLAKYLAAQRNCDTRLAVEEVKKDAKLGAEQIRAAGVNQEEGGAAADARPHSPDGWAETRSEERDVDLDAEVMAATGEGLKGTAEPLAASREAGSQVPAKPRAAFSLPVPVSVGKSGAPSPKMGYENGRDPIESG